MLHQEAIWCKMSDSTPWDTLQNMKPTQCSVVQLLKLYILSWFRYVVIQNMDKKKNTGGMDAPM